MTIQSKALRLRSQGNGDTIEITAQVAQGVRESGLQSGIVTIFVAGATGALTTMEYEPGVVADFGTLFERVAPAGANYEHHARWGDFNGHSHVRAALLGPSLTVPFVAGTLTLGTWQQIVFVDFDTRARSRELIVQIMGE